MFKGISLLFALSLPVFYACQSQESGKSTSPVAKKSSTNEDSQETKTDSTSNSSKDQSSQGSNQSQEQDETKEPAPTTQAEKKDGDLFFQPSDLEKVSYVKVYNYFPSIGVAYVYANLATGEVGRWYEAGKVLKRKAPLTQQEIKDIRQALAEIKVFKPTLTDCSDNTKFGPNFRLDFKLGSEAGMLPAYGIHNCVKGQTDYAYADALINLNGSPLRAPLGVSEEETEIVDE